MKIEMYILMLVVLLTAGCSEDEKIQHITNNTQIYLSPEVINSDYQGGKKTIQVSTEQAWRAQSSVEWLTVSPTEGMGTEKVTISWTDNTSFSDRSAKIKFTAGTDMKELFFNQVHKKDTAHVVSARAIIGNRIIGERDSIEIVFNTPATIRYNIMTDESGETLSTQALSQYDMDGCRYRLGVGMLGMNITCNLEIMSNRDSIVTHERVNIPFYERRNVCANEDIGERVSYSVLSPDKKSIWLSVSGIKWFNPQNRIVQFSTDSLKEIKSIEMPWGPRYLCFNPYNGLLYVLPNNYSGDIGYSNQICVVDPDQGRILKTVSVETSPLAHPQQPTDYPDEIEFTADGLGVLKLISMDNNAREWRWIDSGDGDRITFSGYEWTEFAFDHIYHNFDYSRIYATSFFHGYNETCYVNRQQRQPMILEISGKFNSDKYYAGGNIMDFAMSPRENKCFICTAPGSQCVVNLDPIGYSEVCEEEARGAKCTWDELVTDYDYVWQVCPNLIQLFDMTRGNSIFATYHPYHYEVTKCHHLPINDKFLIVTTQAVWMFDAAEMKRKKML